MQDRRTESDTFAEVRSALFFVAENARISTQLKQPECRRKTDTKVAAEGHAPHARKPCAIGAAGVVVV